jgi:hypothetical protein
VATRKPKRYTRRVRKMGRRGWCAGLGGCVLWAWVGLVALAPGEVSGQPPQSTPAVAPDEVVIRMGERTVTVGELKDALAYQTPGVLQRLREDLNAVRYFAVQWFHRMLFAEAARTDGFLAKNPGLAESAADLARRPIADAYVAEMENEYTATDAEIEQFYKLHSDRCAAPTRYRIARVGVVIGVHATPKQEEAGRERIDEIAKRLAAGESFAAVVADSNDMPEKLPGGELGWVTEADLGTDVGGDRFKSLAVGGTTEVIRTPRGLEIFKLIEKQDARLLTLEECRPQLAELLRKQYYEAVRTRRADELVERLGASMNIDNFIAAARSAESIAKPTPTPVPR